MALTTDDLLQNTAFAEALPALAGYLITVYRQNPRITSVFASHQRWLMAQCGYALACRRTAADPSSGLYAARFIEKMLHHDVASRNTAAAFLQEMLAYKFVQPVADAPNRRTRPLEPTVVSIGTMMIWLHAHAKVLDELDGDNRAAIIEANPQLLGLAQPRIADAILVNTNIRDPGKTFSLFGWANSGSLIIDWIVSKVDPARAGDERIPIGGISYSEMSALFLISKTHLKRLFHQAMDTGGIGYTQAGRNEMWMSKTFFDECRLYQAEKFAIIDCALKEVFEETGIRPDESQTSSPGSRASDAGPTNAARPG